MRLDKYLQEKLDISRNKAQMLVSDESITINGRLMTKSSFDVSENDAVEIADNEKVTYVSRSAIKLKRFFESHVSEEPTSSKNTWERKLQVKNKICLDIGSSTGGFTEILLEYGAKQVFSLDVGTSQLAEKLQNIPKITSIENTDIRDYKSSTELDIITCDVSFISLTKIIDSIINLSNSETEIILLYKPQFEVGSKNLTKKNIPKTDKITEKFLVEFGELLRSKNIKTQTTELSGLEGEAGNKEYFIWCKKKEA